MAKVINCGKLNPASGCQHVCKGETVDEVLDSAKQHAQEDHGMNLEGELLEKVKGAIEEG